MSEVEVTDHPAVSDGIEAEIKPPEPTHVMVDLETWGTGNKAVPVSLGAARFTADKILDMFHVAIDPVSAQLHGLEIDAETILWWFDPGRDEARKRWLGMERVDIGSALSGFAEWLNQNSPVALWGNGSTFDNVILRSAYAATGLEYPIRFWQDQCYRTIKYLTPECAIEREGTHHDALDDAVSQAKHLQRIWRQLGAGALRDMLERCQQQFTFYGEQHRAKIDGLSDESTLREATIHKAEVNEGFALEIRQLLDGGPHEA